MFGFGEKKKRSIHLDYASTTPVRTEVLEAMLPYFGNEWANPGAIYKAGVHAREVVEEARTRIARMLRIRPRGVIFTSGGTEANNHAIIGVVEALHKAGRAYSTMEIVTTEIEHASVLAVCDVLKERGVRVHYAPLSKEGLIEHAQFSNILSSRTVLVTLAYANSEIGVVQDIKKITRTVRAHNVAHKTLTLVHLDAAQAPLWLPCEMDMLGVDLLSLDSGKCYGPKGAGVLAVRHGVILAPLMHGGGQEGGLRSGTENVPLIVGCTKALLLAQAAWESRARTTCILRDSMFELIATEIPEAVVNGSRESRIANNVHISIPGVDAEFAVITLDHHGVNVSTKSACGARKGGGSAVVRTLTGDESLATSTIRFTLGEETTQGELRKAIVLLREHVEKVRQSVISLTGTPV